MSKKELDRKSARQAKHARFETPTAAPNRTPLLVGGGVAILAGVLIAAGVLFAMNRPASPVSGTSSMPPNPTTRTSPANVQTRYTPVQAADGVVRWSLATFDDGQAHYYSFVDGAKSIDFFVLESSDGVVRAAFDACDVCWPARKGYRQQGDLMVCNNCGQQFPSVKINEVRGGCNPAPLERATDGPDLVIRTSDILAGTGYF